MLDGIPQLGQAISDLARKGLIITMFFIGASLSMDVLKQVGMKTAYSGSDSVGGNQLEYIGLYIIVLRLGIRT